MQQHPVPRDIIGFRFKLIGDMTLKQFGYLAGGIILGYVLSLVLPFPGTIRVVIWLFFGGGGAALAFVPIEGRSLDVWISAYLKSVYSPTQFVWKKQTHPPQILLQTIKSKHSTQNRTLSAKSQTKGHNQQTKQITRKQYEEVEQKLNSYYVTTGKKTHELIDKKERFALKRTRTTDGQSIPTKIKSKPVPAVRKSLFKKTPFLEQTLQPSRKEKSKISEDAIRARVRKELEDQYKQELERLRREKEQIEQKMKSLGSSITTAKEKQKIKQKKSPFVRILSQQEATQVGFPLSVDKPNIVVGTIVDPQEKQLPGILVTIKNKQGKIVRALKTNNLGQFISLTALPNGQYILEAEDPNRLFKFDIIKIGLHGKIFPPVELIAKTIKESKQEKIKKELFNKQ